MQNIVKMIIFKLILVGLLKIRIRCSNFYFREVKIKIIILLKFEEISLH